MRVCVDENKRLFQEKFDNLLLFEYFSCVEFVKDIYEKVTDIICNRYSVENVDNIYPDYSSEESIVFLFSICKNKEIWKVKLIVPVYKRHKWKLVINDKIRRNSI